MAASAKERDFAHLVASALRLPLELRAIPEFESAPSQHLHRIPEVTANVDDKTLVVVGLGDNAKNETAAEFVSSYGKLLKAAHGLRLVCMSTWWGNAALDRQMKKQCEDGGGRFVGIGDLRQSPQNPDQQSGPQYAIAAVNDHPHDWGMARIAERVVAAWRGSEEKAGCQPAARTAP
ncbi:hypothetical protein QTH91_06725 [Variovorax dokdonensis]|uniref:Uncharacterized protein n=2 Tax=Variovorax dokdonensis TaxID=344883 RepID=A0ABT7N8G1_9BURK|nr:hypothetical protein [Variovorax dokdonensis]MDM0044170.1 hypothetical protein [Variovorax dokdonensis]